MPTRDELWRQYEISVDLYKHYLKLAIEINVFFYAITGALVSYYLAHRADPTMRFALLLPFAMSILFGLLFTYGAILNLESRREMFRVRDALELKTSPEFAVLTAFLFIFALLFFGVAVTLGFEIWRCPDDV